MSLIKKLIPITMLSLCVSCQTQNRIDLVQPINIITKEKPISNIQKGNSSIYPINNYTGYYYQDGKLQIIKFPKTILDTYIEGDYKIIKAR